MYGETEVWGIYEDLGWKWVGELIIDILTFDLRVNKNPKIAPKRGAVEVSPLKRKPGSPNSLFPTHISSHVVTSKLGPAELEE